MGFSLRRFLEDNVVTDLFNPNTRADQTRRAAEGKSKQYIHEEPAKLPFIPTSGDDVRRATQGQNYNRAEINRITEFVDDDRKKEASRLKTEAGSMSLWDTLKDKLDANTPLDRYKRTMGNRTQIDSSTNDVMRYLNNMAAPEAVATGGAAPYTALMKTISEGGANRQQEATGAIQDAMIRGQKEQSIEKAIFFESEATKYKPFSDEWNALMLKRDAALQEGKPAEAHRNAVTDAGDPALWKQAVGGWVENQPLTVPGQLVSFLGAEGVGEQMQSPWNTEGTQIAPAGGFGSQTARAAGGLAADAPIFFAGGAIKPSTKLISKPGLSSKLIGSKHGIGEAADIALESQEAGDSFVKSRAKGAASGAFTGITSALATENLLKSIPGKGMFANQTRRVGGEMLEEGSQQGASNIVRSTYDPETGIMDGVAKSAAMGGILSVPFGGIDVYNKLKGKDGDKAEVPSNVLKSFSEDPEIIQLDETYQMYSQQRDALRKQGLSERSAPMIQNKHALDGVMEEANSVIKKLVETAKKGLGESGSSTLFTGGGINDAAPRPPGTEAVKFNSTVKEPHLNVGLKIAKTDKRIAPQKVIEAIEQFGVKVLDHKVLLAKNTPNIEEDTIVPRLSRPLTLDELTKLAKLTGQEAIPQFSDGEGFMVGEKAEEWGPFDTDRFVDQKGRKLTDTAIPETLSRYDPLDGKYPNVEALDTYNSGRGTGGLGTGLYFTIKPGEMRTHKGKAEGQLTEIKNTMENPLVLEDEARGGGWIGDANQDIFGGILQYAGRKMQQVAEGGKLNETTGYDKYWEIEKVFLEAGVEYDKAKVLKAINETKADLAKVKDIYGPERYTLMEKLDQPLSRYLKDLGYDGIINKSQDNNSAGSVIFRGTPAFDRAMELYNPQTPQVSKANPIVEQNNIRAGYSVQTDRSGSVATAKSLNQAHKLAARISLDGETTYVSKSGSGDAGDIDIAQYIDGSPVGSKPTETSGLGESGHIMTPNIKPIKEWGKKPTLQDALDGKTTKIKQQVADEFKFGETAGKEGQPVSKERVLGKPKAEQITTGEDVLLKDRIRSEARGANEGHRAGKAEGKLIEKEKGNIAKEKIRMSAKEKRLAAAAKTKEQKAKTKLRGQIRTELKNSKTKKGVKRPEGKFDADTQLILNEIIKTSKMKWSAAKTEQQTILRDASNVAYYEKHGELPSEAKVRLEVLRYGGMGQMDSIQLEQMLKEVRSIKKNGRTIRQQARDENTKRQDGLIEAGVDEITGGKGLASAGEIKKRRRGVIPALSKLDTYQHALSSIIEKITASDTKNTPYTGELQGMFNKLKQSRRAEDKINLERSKNTQDSFKRIFDVTKLGKGLRANLIDKQQKIVEDLGEFKFADDSIGKLELSQEQAGYFYQKMQDPSLKESLVEGNLWTKEIFDAVEKFLTPESKAWADWQMEEWAKDYGRRNEYWRNKFGADLGLVENYSRVSRDIVKGDTAIGLLAEQQQIHQQSMKPKSAISRKGSKAAIKPQNMTSTFLSDMNAWDHFIAFDESIADFRKVFTSLEIKKAMRESLADGDFANKQILDTVDKVANESVGRNAASGVIEKGVDILRRNFVRSKTALNLNVSIKQTTSMVATLLSDISAKDFGVGMAKFYKNPVKNAKEMYDKSTMLQARYKGGYDRDTMDALKHSSAKTLAGKDSIINKGMITVRAGDFVGLIPGFYANYNAKYNELIKDGVHAPAAEKEAIAHAENVAEMTQQAGNLEDQSPLQSGNAFGKLFTMFLTTPQQYYRMTSTAAKDLKTGKGGRTKNARKLAVAWIVLPTIFQFAANGFQWDDEEQLRAAIVGPLNGIFIAGEAIEYGVSKAVGAKAWGEAVDMPGPIENLNEIWHSAEDIFKYIEGGLEDSEKLGEIIDDIIEEFTSLTGLPHAPLRNVRGFNEARAGVSTTPTGDVRFPIDDSPLNIARSTIFGTNNTPEAAEYFDKNRRPLGEQDSEQYQALADEDKEDFYNMRMGKREDDRERSDQREENIKNLEEGGQIGGDQPTLEGSMEEKVQRINDDKYISGYDTLEEYAKAKGLPEGVTTAKKIAAHISGEYKDYEDAYGFADKEALNEYDKIEKSDDYISTARSMFDGTKKYNTLPDNIKKDYLKKHNITEKQIKYDINANYSSDAKAEVLYRKYRTMDHSKVLDNLLAGRARGISGKQLANDKTLRLLRDAGLISNDEYKNLKKYDSEDGSMKIKLSNAAKSKASGRKKSRKYTDPFSRTGGSGSAAASIRDILEKVTK